MLEFIQGRRNERDGEAGSEQPAGGREREPLKGYNVGHVGWRVGLSRQHWKQGRQKGICGSPPGKRQRELELDPDFVGEG